MTQATAPVEGQLAGFATLTICLGHGTLTLPAVVQGPPNDTSERTGYQRIYAYDLYASYP